MVIKSLKLKLLVRPEVLPLQNTMEYASVLHLQLMELTAIIMLEITQLPVLLHRTTTTLDGFPPLIGIQPYGEVLLSVLDLPLTLMPSL
jgi:hypothetical protein